MKPSRAIFLEQTQSRRLGVDVKLQTRRPRGCPARPKGVGAPPTLVIAHLGAFVGAPPEGESTTKGLYIILKASPMSYE